MEPFDFCAATGLNVCFCGLFEVWMGCLHCQSVNCLTASFVSFHWFNWNRGIPEYPDARRPCPQAPTLVTSFHHPPTTEGTFAQSICFSPNCPSMVFIVFELMFTEPWQGAVLSHPRCQRLCLMRSLHCSRWLRASVCLPTLSF